ncbi:MAG: septum formation initiator family protein [Patescibacteria group bacterium]
MNRILSSSWVTVIGLVVLAVVGASLVRREPQLAAVKQEREYVRKSIDAARLEQEELDRKQAYYQSTGYLEQQARIKLNYKKPGEHVVYIYRTASEPQETKPEESLTNLKLWWYYLIGKK